MTLRLYQTRAIEQLRENVRRRILRQLLVAPTGAGKTTIAAEVIRRAVERGRRVWFVAHRRELISQCSARLTQHGIEHGIIQADTPETESLVQVISLQTLVRRADGRYPAPDLIIIDEAHRATANSYTSILALAPSATVIGLTATPWRADGSPLGNLFETIVLVATPEELISDGFLLTPRVFSGTAPDLNLLPVARGDYVTGDLELRMTPKLTGEIIANWRHTVRKGRTVVFAVSVKHSRALVEAFQREGIRAAHVDAETPKPERDQILAGVHSGDCEVVCNVGILTEGWDLPSLSAVVLARPTKSEGLFLQMCGRGMRPFPGKREFLLLDHGGCITQHGFPQETRNYSLTTKLPRPKPKALKTCKQCFFVYEVGPTACPECGYEPTPAERKALEVEEGILLEREYRKREAQVAEAERLAELRRLYEIEKQKSYRRGWVDHVYVKKFKEKPTEALRRKARV